MVRGCLCIFCGVSDSLYHHSLTGDAPADPKIENFIGFSSSFGKFRMDAEIVKSRPLERDLELLVVTSRSCYSLPLCQEKKLPDLNWASFLLISMSARRSMRAGQGAN